MISLLSACSWISRDYYFHSSEVSDFWGAEFRSGIANTKRAGYPDSVIYSYFDEDVKIGINVSYQDTTFWGPLLFPIVPLPWKSRGDFYVLIDIEAKVPVVYDSTAWIVKDLNTDLVYKPEVEPRSLIGVDKITSLIEFPVSASSLTNIELQLSEFKYNGKTIKPEKLVLSVKKGDWHFQQFTM